MRVVLVVDARGFRGFTHAGRQVGVGCGGGYTYAGWVMAGLQVTTQYVVEVKVFSSPVTYTGGRRCKQLRRARKFSQHQVVVARTGSVSGWMN